MTMTMKKRKKTQPSTSRRLRLYIAKHILAQPIETFILDTNDATERKNPPEIWTVSLFQPFVYLCICDEGLQLKWFHQASMLIVTNSHTNRKLIVKMHTHTNLKQFARLFVFSMSQLVLSTVRAFLFVYLLAFHPTFFGPNGANNIRIKKIDEKEEKRCID